MTTIKLKNGSGAPAASDLVQGEPALDLTNKRLYSEDASGNVIEVGTNPTTLGIGEASPLASLHINEGDIGSFTALGRQVAILERSGASFLSLLSGASSQAGIDFGDPDDVDAGSLRFDNNGNYFALRIADSEKIRLDSNGDLGVGTTDPTSKLHVSGTSGAGSRVHIESTGAGLSSFDGSGSGLLLTAGGMNTTSKFTPAIQFGSTDPQFTTTNPKVGAAINAVARETYSADNDGSMALVFYTTPVEPGTGQTTTERMRVNQDGNLLVGTTSGSLSGAGIKLRPTSSGTNSTANVQVTGDGGSGDVGYGLYDTGDGAYKFYVRYEGKILATSTSITSLSDVSLKENLRDLDKGLDTINALQPRRFDWKNGDGNDIMGFVAQEVEDVLPELVHEYKYTDEETKLALKMGDMIPSMVKAIQELSAQVNDLKAEIAALKGV